MAFSMLSHDTQELCPTEYKNSTKRIQIRGKLNDVVGKLYANMIPMAYGIKAQIRFLKFCFLPTLSLSQ